MTLSFVSVLLHEKLFISTEKVITKYERETRSTDPGRKNTEKKYKWRFDDLGVCGLRHLENHFPSSAMPISARIILDPI